MQLSYDWTVPAGWTITGGQGTTSITVTTGNTGADGNIIVTPKSCGPGASASLAVSVIGVPAAAGPITGTLLVCPGTTVNYSVAPVQYTETYTWSVPAGWTITSGQNSNSITVTTGFAGQNGNISVATSNVCAVIAGSPKTVLINPVIATNNTGYVTNGGTKNSDGIQCNAPASLGATERRGYIKFPLTSIPAGANITGSTLKITNNNSLTLSQADNNVTALGNNDPVSTTGNTLFTAIGSGTIL